MIVNEESRTSMRKVFSGGIVATGTPTVILAMGAAKQAAHAIDRMLRKE